MECERVIPCDILDDLCSRFIINVPDEERRDLIRICFQIESAHWFYLDFYSKNFPTKKPCGIKEFAQQIFKHLPFLQPYSNNVEKIIDDWKDYKFCVPTFGAILLDEDLSHVLLVQSYCSRSSWGFPKGKVNKDEPPYQCAIREVYEETGFDISNLIKTNEYIEANVNDQVIRLYLIPGINKHEKFEPKTRNEIKSVNWFPICDIPINKKEATLKLGTGANTFFLVSPFLRRLRQWIFDHNQRLPRKLFRRQRHKSCSDIDCIRYRASTLNLKESVAMLKSFKDKRRDFISNTVSNEVNCGKGNEKQIGKPDSNILEQSTCIESTDSHLNSSIVDCFHHCYCVEQVSLEQSMKKNCISDDVNHPEELKKTVIIVRNKSVAYDNHIDNMITKKEMTATSVSTENSVQTTWSDSVLKVPFKQNVGLLSHESAFRKVEKSTKNKKRNRGKKLVKSLKCEDANLCSSEVNGEISEKHSKFYKNEYHGDINKSSKSNNDLIECFYNEKDSVCDQEPFMCVTRWVNFKFDINEILRSMEEASSSKNK